MPERQPVAGDKAHVVVHGEPGDDAVLGGELQLGAQLCELLRQHGGRNNNGFLRARRAAGELEEKRFRAGTRIARGEFPFLQPLGHLARGK